jgi:hypothetical protein
MTRQESPKLAARRLLNFSLDRALAHCWGCDLFPQPRPQKPSSIITQVEGSGTAGPTGTINTDRRIIAGAVAPHRCNDVLFSKRIGSRKPIEIEMLTSQADPTKRS